MWFEVSKNAKDLLAKMLEKDPYKRISADSALQHPWFTSHHEQGPRKTSGFLKDLSLYFVLLA
jgi:serine/threonine protein kinase